jgi:hypothetical protein
LQSVPDSIPIQRPILIQISYPDAFLVSRQFLLETRVGVFDDESDHIVAKILPKPIKNLADLKGLSSEMVAGRIIDKGMGHLV